ncbi:unnamed protein product [Pleuronectes platessa]|uniref:Uncharacterized protein n=1 Tax=Pleuronectes platessa TaxID=8262 RepID=A0A9N7TXC6_PLEPL|nr:unnamed protein product [Pleuronectes platessa]
MEKSRPNYRAVSPPLCSTGPREQGGLIRIWLLGAGPEKKGLSSSPPLLSFSSPPPPLLPLSAPRLRLYGAETPVLCRDTYVSRGRTDFRPGAGTEDERTGHADSNTEARRRMNMEHGAGNTQPEPGPLGGGRPGASRGTDGGLDRHVIEDLIVSLVSSTDQNRYDPRQTQETVEQKSRSEFSCFDLSQLPVPPRAEVYNWTKPVTVASMGTREVKHRGGDSGDSGDGDGDGGGGGGGPTIRPWHLIASARHRHPGAELRIKP